MTGDRNFGSHAVLRDIQDDRIRPFFRQGLPPSLSRRLTPPQPILFTAALGAMALPGCSGPLSILDPAGANARAVADLWQVMLIGSVAIFIFIMAMVLASFTPARRFFELPSRVWLIGGGLVFPAVTLLALLVYALVLGESLLPHGKTDDAGRIEAIARQWEWTFRYSTAQATATAGVLHLPEGRPVDVHVRSDDVIHSFWIPRLSGKVDAVPGHVTVIRLHALAPGRYAGLCSEFCGIGHAHMGFVAEVHPAAEYDERMRVLGLPAVSGTTR